MQRGTSDILFQRCHSITISCVSPHGQNPPTTHTSHSIMRRERSNTYQTPMNNLQSFTAMRDGRTKVVSATSWHGALLSAVPALLILSAQTVGSFTTSPTFTTSLNAAECLTSFGTNPLEQCRPVPVAPRISSDPFCSWSCSTSGLAMSAVMEPPSTRRSKRVSNFANRMRNLVTDRRGSEVGKVVDKKNEERHGTKARPSNLQVVNTLEDYKRIVGMEKDRIVVVRFFATWCKACKAMAPYFYRMCQSNPNILFVEVPVTDKNAKLHQGLGVPSLPYGHIYDPAAGLVEEMKISKPYFKQFEQMLRWYKSGKCQLPESGCQSPFVTGSEESFQ